eukprot:1552738-Rhodomonas_salina.3
MMLHHESSQAEADAHAGTDSDSGQRPRSQGLRPSTHTSQAALQTVTCLQAALPISGLAHLRGAVPASS